MPLPGGAEGPISGRVIGSVETPSRLERLIQAAELDGQPLFRAYRAPEQYIHLELALKAQAKSGRLFANTNGKAFVIWAADWMRRTYRGGARKWADIASALGAEGTQQEWRALTDLGLAQCKRPLLIHSGMALRLTTLAREGGFPLAAIENGASWPKHYLSALVGGQMSLDEPTLAGAAQMAESFEDMVPLTWRSEELRWLCADLTLAIVEIRRSFETSASECGLKISEWLALNFAKWESRLPILISNEAAARLVDALLHVPPFQKSNFAAVSRVLRQRGDRWIPAICLDLDGQLVSPTVARTDTDRLRLYAAGRFATYCPRELAVAERASDSDAWTIQARRSNQVFDCPLEVAADIELRQDARTVARLTLPGGSPCNSGPLLCTQSIGEDQLELVGTTGGRFAAERLYALLPQGWSARPSAENETVNPIPGEVLGRYQVEICGGAILQSPDGDLHRVRCGQKGDSRDEIVLAGRRVDPLTPTNGDETLFLGSPSIQLSEGPVCRSGRAGELYVRTVGSREWLPIGPSLLPGYFDIGWKDIETGHLRAKRRIGVLPAGASVQLRKANGTVGIHCTGFDNLKPPPSWKYVNDVWWEGDNGGRRRRAVLANLQWRGVAQSIRIEIAHEPTIAFWDDCLVGAGATISISQLYKMVACCNTPIELFAQLYDRTKTPISGTLLRWQVDQELPLASIMEDLQFLFSSNADVDGRIELRFNNATEKYWYVDQFGQRLVKDRRKLRLDGIDKTNNSQLVSRSMTDPLIEHDLGPFCDWSEGQYIRLPEKAAGLWMVYLRQGANVLTRPEMQMGTTAADENAALSPLSAAMAPSDRWERYRLIDKLFAEIVRGGPNSLLLSQGIVDLILSLHGLAAAAFDVLQRAAEKPDVLAALAVNASLQHRPFVMSLADQLPFCWTCLPKASWDRATRTLAGYLFETLGELPEAPQIVGQEISLRRQALVASQPSLAAALDMRRPTRRLQEIAQIFLQRNADSVLPFADFAFTPSSSLPTWQFDRTYWSSLNAPCVAILAAHLGYKPTALELRAIRAVSHQYPEYFGDAANAFYQETIHGRH